MTAGRGGASEDLGHWYDNAVVYSLDVRTFQDSNGDGIGDFDGLRSRLDYLSGLGVTVLWLLPFLPTPFRDGGYDVTDYYDVDETLGGMAGFVRFARQAQELGLRFIVDLPLNHTSVDHPWFQSARNDRNSRYRDYYIWADEPPAGPKHQVVFHGRPEPWTFDDAAGQYYLHRFYADEPDLNHANPAVREEVLQVIEFWLDLGASGVRVDAAPYLAEKATADPTEQGPRAFFEQMHRRATAQRGDALLLAEADVKPDELRDYFGDGNRVQMLFNFLMNNYFFLALAREEAEPLQKVLGILPHRPPGGQWANWVRNHDELDLERLTSRERDDVLAAFAPEDDMRIYGRGIRRRLPPMVGGDERRIESAYALLFALPGTPIIRYGEEIGMGDDLGLPERQAVRTPMQWTPTPNGGFSSADPSRLVVRANEDERFGYCAVNVADQQRTRDSLLARIQLLVRVRRQHPEIGWGEPTVMRADAPSVCVLSYDAGDRKTIAAHNLAGRKQRVRLAGLDGHEYLYDVVADRRYDALDESTWQVDVGPYGYRWFVVRRADEGGASASASTADASLRRPPR